MLKIIFEDEYVMVVEKPAGVPCLPVKDGKAETIYDQLCHREEALGRRGDLPCGGLLRRCTPRNDKEPFTADHGIVHRLDNDTSGCLLAAKDHHSYELLRHQFNEHSIKKIYTALVLGETPANGMIDAPIVHDPKNKGKMKIAPLSPTLSLKGRGSPRPALTTYRLIKRLKAGAYSLLEITIKTGVRHQIRVHLSSIGYPLAGDRLYQNVRQRERDKTGLKRQFLHASLIGFTHPVTKKWMEFKSELPEELLPLLK